MENPIIGIKIADGTYFPILEDGNRKRKRLLLTTVNDNQESVQIDLYKGSGNELLDAVYIGSLLIEDIVQGPKESSEIELKIGFDQNGTLNAEAGDLASGQFESLSLSMENLDEASMYDTPEFSLDDDLENLQIDEEDLVFDDIPEDESSIPEFDEDEDFGDSFDETLEDEPEKTTSIPEVSEEIEDNLQTDSNLEEDGFTTGRLPESGIEEHRRDKKKSNPFLIALLVIIAIAAIAGISYLIFRGLQGENSPALEASSDSGKSLSTTESEAAESETPTESPESTVESTKEEHQSNETTTAPGSALQDTSGVWYKIRWGDTLWGISYSFYDSPWDYNTIAKENDIKNPNIIFAESKIFIPSK